MGKGQSFYTISEAEKEEHHHLVSAITNYQGIDKIASRQYDTMDNYNFVHRSLTYAFQVQEEFGCVKLIYLKYTSNFREVYKTKVYCRYAIFH